MQSEEYQIDSELTGSMSTGIEPLYKFKDISRRDATIINRIAFICGVSLPQVVNSEP
jgi:hypothetical protein